MVTRQCLVTIWHMTGSDNLQHQIERQRHSSSSPGVWASQFWFPPVNWIDPLERLVATSKNLLDPSEIVKYHRTHYETFRASAIDGTEITPWFSASKHTTKAEAAADSSGSSYQHISNTIDVLPRTIITTEHNQLKRSILSRFCQSVSHYACTCNNQSYRSIDLL